MGLFSNGTNSRRNNDYLGELIKYHEKNEALINDGFEKWKKSKRAYFNGLEQVYVINNAFQESTQSCWGVGYYGADFTPFNKLSEEDRNSDYTKKTIKKAVDNTYKWAVDTFLNEDKIIGIDNMMAGLQPLSFFGFEKSRIDHSNKHYNYFCNREYVKSVLTDWDDIEQGFTDLDENRVDDSVIPFINRYLLQAQEYANNGEYEKAYNRLTGAEYDVSMFDEAKKFLLWTAMAAREWINKPDYQALYEQIKEIVEKMFSFYILGKDAEGKLVKYKTVIPDVLIAEAIVLKRSGKIEQINEKLKGLLDLGKEDLNQKQYDVLRRVFAFLGAYEQEVIVLEGMVENGVTRTEEQEKRLVFLRNNTHVLTPGSVYKELEYDHQDDKLVYDYRLVTWDDSQIDEYFKLLSAENRVARNIVVAAEWTKNLNIQSGIPWNIASFHEKLENLLKDEIDDNLSCIVVEASLLSGEYLEFAPVIFIAEYDEKIGRFPWLAFVVSSEQITKKQMSLSVYALYIPKRDYCSITDVIERNKMLQQRYLSIKHKQNPKINNYLFTVQSLILEEMEKYINSEMPSESIY